jgi:hypothetical protein
MTQKLTLPPLTDLNTYITAERQNRYVAAKIKREQTGLVCVMAKQQLEPVDEVREITFYWKHANKRKDFDNVEASQKFIRDGLMEAGIIQSDGWKHLPPKTVHYHRVDKNDPGVEVVIC